MTSPTTDLLRSKYPDREAAILATSQEAALLAIRPSGRHDHPDLVRPARRYELDAVYSAGWQIKTISRWGQAPRARRKIAATALAEAATTAVFFAADLIWGERVGRP